jgi:NAD(P)-dependent dehydrogenase (short-subunit alcohol dehydrogenase family)
MLSRRLAIVTGATGAIGGAIANAIAAGPNFEVLILVRDETKGRRMVQRLKNETGNEGVDCAVVDLSLQQSIRDFAAQFDRPVQVLINDAAIAPRSRHVTAEGREVMFATNVLGYYWLTLALATNLTRGSPARVVNVASYWAGDMDLSDLEFIRRPYHNDTAYRQSKQANRMLTVALAERLHPHNITVNVCHPGDVNSTLSNALGFGGSESPETGALTPVWLAKDHSVATTTGKYFVGCRQESCTFARDRTGIDRLVAVCNQMS